MCSCEECSTGDSLEVWSQAFGSLGDVSGQTALWIQDPTTEPPPADVLLELVQRNIAREARERDARELARELRAAK